MKSVQIELSLHSNYEKIEITLIAAMLKPLIMIKYQESHALENVWLETELLLTEKEISAS